MANTTPGVTNADMSLDRIEREMELTRESISAKVSALENQVAGTIQTATNTITDTVQAVKDTVTTAPTVVKESIQESVAAMKDTVKESFASVTSFDLGACLSNHPAAAMGASVATGFVTGFLLFDGKDSHPLTARGFSVPSPNGHPVAAPYGATAAPSARPGLFTNLCTMVGDEVEQLAKHVISTALESLKTSVNEQMPRLVDGAVRNVANLVGSHKDSARGVNGACNPTVAPAVGL